MSVPEIAEALGTNEHDFTRGCSCAARRDFERGLASPRGAAQRLSEWMS